MTLLIPAQELPEGEALFGGWFNCCAGVSK